MTALGPLGLGSGQVRLARPDPRWQRWFEEEAERIRAALQDREAAVEHVGSTSVPGLAAKPILDLLLGLPAPIDLPPVIAALNKLGYEHATWAGVPGSEVFGKGQPRTHLVHLVPIGSASWQRMLRFRDRLRADAGLRDDYGALKQALAARFPQDRAAYTEAKAAFITRVTEEA